MMEVEHLQNQDRCYMGVSIDIIKRLREKLKFDYVFIESPDNKFGNQVNGKWNGLINEIHQKVSTNTKDMLLYNTYSFNPPNITDM